mgnify:FL=1
MNAKTDEATKRKTLTWQNPVTPSTSKNLEITDHTKPKLAKLKATHEHTMYKAWGLTTMKELIGRLQRNTNSEANMTKMELMEANVNELVKVVEYAMEYNMNKNVKANINRLVKVVEHTIKYELNKKVD